MESATSNNGPKPLEHHNFHANQIRDKKRGEFSIESLLLSKGKKMFKMIICRIQYVLIKPRTLAFVPFHCTIVRR